MAEASASFQLRVNAGSYASAGDPVDAVEGDTITARVVSVDGINGSQIDWSFFGTSGVSGPTLTEAGTPSGREVSFTVPSGLSPDGAGFGLQCDVNGGSLVTLKSATTATAAIFVLNAAGERPFVFYEVGEENSTYRSIPRLNRALNHARRNFTDIDNTDSPYTALAADATILVDCSGGAVTVNLPAVASSSKRVIVVKDASGDSNSNNITIDGNASETIDGSTTLTLSTNYASTTLFCNGTEWLTL